MNDVKVLKIRNYKTGYQVRTEEVLTHFEDKPKGHAVVMKSAYTPEGWYIGSSQTAYRLCKKRGIKPELAHPTNNVCSIGFCEKEQKWFGWSHRAIWGFGIGDTVKKGDCAYQPVDLNDAWEEYLDFFGEFLEEMHDGPPKNPNRRRQNIHDMFEEFQTTKVDNGMRAFKLGKGKWTAKTFEDCKQMAIAFADSVG